MKAILLTPDHQNQTITVQAVEVLKEPGCEDPSLTSMYALLDCTQVQMNDCSETGVLKGHVAFVDEDGLYKDNQGFTFCPHIGPQPYAGKILLLKSSGSSVSDVTVDIEVLRQLPSLVYANPRFAAHALKQLESRLRANYPGMIVMDTSSLIFDKLSQ